MEIYKFLETVNLLETNFKIQQRPGVDLDAILAIETKLNIQLPSDLVAFYLITNGIEGDDWIFNIVPIDELIKDQDAFGEYLLFAEYMIYTEICGLEIDRADHNRYKIFTWTGDPNSEKDISSAPSLPSKNFPGESLHKLLKSATSKTCSTRRLIASSIRITQWSSRAV